MLGWTILIASITIPLGIGFYLRGKDKRNPISSQEKEEEERKIREREKGLWRGALIKAGGAQINSASMHSDRGEERYFREVGDDENMGDDQP